MAAGFTAAGFTAVGFTVGFGYAEVHFQDGVDVAGAYAGDEGNKLLVAGVEAVGNGLKVIKRFT